MINNLNHQDVNLNTTFFLTADPTLHTLQGTVWPLTCTCFLHCSLQTENTVSDSFDLYYGLFMYNVNATEQASYPHLWSFIRFFSKYNMWVGLWAILLYLWELGGAISKFSSLKRRNYCLFNYPLWLAFLSSMLYFFFFFIKLTIGTCFPETIVFMIDFIFLNLKFLQVPNQQINNQGSSM